MKTNILQNKDVQVTLTREEYDTIKQQEEKIEELEEELRKHQIEVRVCMDYGWTSSIGVNKALQIYTHQVNYIQLSPEQLTSESLKIRTDIAKAISQHLEENNVLKEGEDKTNRWKERCWRYMDKLEKIPMWIRRIWKAV